MEDQYDEFFFAGYRRAEVELSALSAAELDSISDQSFKQAVAWRMLGDSSRAADLEGRAVAAMMLELARTNAISYFFDEDNVRYTRAECVPMQTYLEHEFQAKLSTVSSEQRKAFLKAVADGNLHRFADLAAQKRALVQGGSTTGIASWMRWFAILLAVAVIAWLVNASRG